MRISEVKAFSGWTRASAKARGAAYLASLGTNRPARVTDSKTG